ncbi:PREDICTED: uncharacterized protein LOC104376736, partial [Tauraco erythrolophus]|uniref:uncharacterized protein LOC104376736 n=1 Tax=Tauraco erythrolophus TaxID=121530 RepID=UPI000523BA5D
NLLGISWVDSSWIPILNNGSVLDYFSERSNPFYDRTCNNEVVKMQRMTLDHLNQMVGVEYILLHAQEPILFIIRKQQRQSPTQGFESSFQKDQLPRDPSNQSPKKVEVCPPEVQGSSSADSSTHCFCDRKFYYFMVTMPKTASNLDTVNESFSVEYFIYIFFLSGWSIADSNCDASPIGLPPYFDPQAFYPFITIADLQAFKTLPN